MTFSFHFLDIFIIFASVMKLRTTISFFMLIAVTLAHAQKSWVYGRVFPEHAQDLSFENDRVGFRLYGPESQEKNENLYGYDIFAKRVPNLILNKWYANQFNPVFWGRIGELKKQGRKAEANALQDSITYHLDHGEGADFYAVGPTLGAGTSALLDGDRIVYPYCYKTVEILQNGPYVFKAHLAFTPFSIGADKNVVEHRILELKKGSQLCKCTVWYEGLTHDATIVTGIVMHKPSTEFFIDEKKRFMSYNEPTQSPEAGNGIIYIGVKFEKTPEKIEKQMFEKPKGQAVGHLLAFSRIDAGEKFTYFFGFGWSKYGFESEKEWIKYLKKY